MLVLALLILIAIGPLAAVTIGTLGVVSGSVVLGAVVTIAAFIAWWRSPRSPWRADDWKPIEYQ